MPGILEPQVEKYLSSLLPERDAVLADMERYAKEHDSPIIGPDCGRLLALVAKISGAKRIFEMGSAIGYSAIWFARAAGPGAEVYFTPMVTPKTPKWRVRISRRRESRNRFVFSPGMRWIYSTPSLAISTSF